MISPTVVILAVGLKASRSLRDGIRVCLQYASRLSFDRCADISTSFFLVTGLGTPNYPALLSLFMGMP